MTSPWVFVPVAGLTGGALVALFVLAIAWSVREERRYREITSGRR